MTTERTRQERRQRPEAGQEDGASGSTDSGADSDPPDERTAELDELPREELETYAAELLRERDEARERAAEFEETVEQQNHRLNDLEGSLAELQGIIEANASGDLTRRADVTSDVDSVIELVSSYNRMLDEWNTTLKRVNEFSTTVDQSTTDVAHEVETIEDESARVSQSVTEIANGADEQSEHLQQVSDEMRSLSATIQEVAASANEVASSTDQAVAKGNSAQTAATKAIDDLESMAAQTQQMVATVEQLDDRMEDIEEITSFITEVAEDTNMLALNANIEAARAGEAGAGFGVVANEVKALATETKEATSEISDTVADVQEQTEETVKNMHETRSAVSDTEDAVQATIDELNGVVEMVKSIDTSVQEIDSAADDQAQVTQSVVSMVDEVSAVSQETTASAQTVAQAAETQTESVTDVSGEMAALSNKAQALGQTVTQFTTGERTQRTVSKSDTVVDFWHAMGGSKSLLLHDLAREFEEQHAGDVYFNLTSQGSYDGVLQETLTAVESGTPPAIAQINEIGGAQARQSGAFKPAAACLPASAVDSLVDSVREYYTIEDTLHSVPFNSSNPLLCLNRDLFERAGLDPRDPPATLDAIREASERLVEAGMCDYGITFANYSWFVEQWFAEAGQELVDNENGRAGAPTTAYLDSPTGVDLFEWWTSMETEGLYLNPGIKARGAAKNAFHSGRAAMLIGSTSSLGGILSGADFDVETGPLPVLDERNGVLVGGASLWIGDGLDPEVESVVSEFLAWLLEPEQQARWHRETGYFPVSKGAISLLEREGWFEENPQFATAFDQFEDTVDTPATNGAQMGPFPEVRSIIETGRDEMEGLADVPATMRNLNQQINAELAAWQADD